MAKYKNILHILNLLCNRMYVPVKTMTSVCDVSKRTIYRYIQEISEANLPVYYDTKLGGYRLLQKENLHIDAIRTEEAVLIISALKFLSFYVNERYKALIGDTINKFATSQPLEFEEILRVINLSIENSSTAKDYSVNISSILIQTAILFNKKIRLTVKSRKKGKGKSSIEIDNPSLWFKRSWNIVSKEPGAIKSARLKDVEIAALLE
jgi:predicted DNA-binding transcriptional regulator YafY